MFGGNFAPNGWALCDGQVLPISQNDTLFVLIGTTYGGDGQSTFALPDLRGRLPLHQGTSTTGTSYTIGAASGVETVTLTQAQLPSHTHALMATDADGTSADPTGNVWAQSDARPYANEASPEALAAMHAGNLSASGGGQPHGNVMPFLCVHFIISLFGVFPSQS